MAQYVDTYCGDEPVGHFREGHVSPEWFARGLRQNFDRVGIKLGGPFPLDKVEHRYVRVSGQVGGPSDGDTLYEFRDKPTEGFTPCTFIADEDLDY